MAKTRSYSDPPARPINQWVRDALDNCDLSNAEIGRLFYEKGLIGSPDRSLAGKMANFRDVSAAEMLYLSEITGYPPPSEDDALIEDEDAIIALLERIKFVGPGEGPKAMRLLMAVFVGDAGSPPHTHLQERPEPATPRRGSEPSGKPSRQPAS